MNLHTMLLARAAAGKPLRVGLIGAGKFGSMYLAQAKHTPGVHVTGIADLAPDRARAALDHVAERRVVEDHVRRHAALAREPQPDVAQDVEQILVDVRQPDVAPPARALL